jgi:hypothetical protein
MKLNRSLAISSKIQQFRQSNMLGVLEKEFPSDLLNTHSPANARSRVFTPSSTLLTMVLTALQEDKTLKSSVDLYYMAHQQHKQFALKEIEESLKREKAADMKVVKKAGRPKTYNARISKSLEKDISLNTAAYSKARDRVPMEMINLVFSGSRINDANNDYTHWHNYRVMEGDGTYVQMQDTQSLRKVYEVKHNGQPSQGYPQGLLEVVIERGTGQIYSFRLGNRHLSELELFGQMIDELPSESLLLLDDLYNCYEIIAKCMEKNIQILVPAKRKRIYELVEVIAQGDEIIKIQKPKTLPKWTNIKQPENLLLRQITCKTPDGKEYLLHTTILDKTITKEEFQMLYLTRWDIEIGIREIKTLMDINVLRSKTPEMVLKELTVSLAAYNLIRKIMYASIKDLPFSPKEDFIQEFYTFNKEILMDKKGRIYNRWSTGRRRTSITDQEGNAAEAKA